MSSQALNEAHIGDNSVAWAPNDNNNNNNNEQTQPCQPISGAFQMTENGQWQFMPKHEGGGSSSENNNRDMNPTMNDMSDFAMQNADFAGNGNGNGAGSVDMSNLYSNPNFAGIELEQQQHHGYIERDASTFYAPAPAPPHTHPNPNAATYATAFHHHHHHHQAPTMQQQQQHANFAPVFETPSQVQFLIQVQVTVSDGGVYFLPPHHSFWCWEYEGCWTSRTLGSVMGRVEEGTWPGLWVQRKAVGGEWVLVFLRR